MLYNKISEYQNKLLNTETIRHEENVSRLVLYIARHFNFSDKELFHLGEIAKLHDIGKIRVPMEIIEKPGKLTEEEYEIAKKHSEYGRDILKELGFSNRYSDMVYQHHERPDGKGYPLGLQGKDIMLEAQIIGLSDILDALLMERVYKKPWPHEKVKEFFIKNRERFSQKIVDIIVNNFEEILTLRQ